MFKDLATVITIISLSAFFTLIGGCSSNTSTSKTSSTPGSKMSAKGPMPSKDVEFERVTDNAPAIAKPGVSDVEFERVTQAAPPAPPAPKSSDVEFEKVGGQGEVEFERIEDEPEVEFEKVGGEVEFEKVGGEVEFEKVNTGSKPDAKEVEFERVKD